MLVGVTGTHGVGKTTFINLLAQQLAAEDVGHRVAAESARKCPLPINREATPLSQLWILADLLTQQLAHTGELVICDRTIFDTIAYCKYHRRIPQWKFLVDMQEEIVTKNLLRYDILIWIISDGFPLEADGVRDSDPLYQKAIEDLLDETLKELGVKVDFFLTFPGVVERIKSITTYVVERWKNYSIN